MSEAYIVHYIRTPIGRFGGALASVRADDLAATAIAALLGKIPTLDLAAIDEVVFGCANQAGEDNRNVGRMAALLAGLPVSVAGHDGEPALRLGHGRRRHRGAADQDRGGRSRDRRRRRKHVARALRHAQGRDGLFPPCGDPRHDDRLALRQPGMQQLYGIDSMPETAENVAERFGVSRADQDAFAARSQAKAVAAQASGRLGREITPVTIPQRKGAALLGRSRRTSPGRHDTRKLGETADTVSPRRHGDGRQCLGDQRRRGRPPDRVGRGRRSATASSPWRACSAPRRPGSSRA